MPFLLLENLIVFVFIAVVPWIFSECLICSVFEQTNIYFKLVLAWISVISIMRPRFKGDHLGLSQQVRISKLLLISQGYV